MIHYKISCSLTVRKERRDNYRTLDLQNSGQEQALNSRQSMHVQIFFNTVYWLCIFSFLKSMHNLNCFWVHCLNGFRLFLLLIQTLTNDANLFFFSASRHYVVEEIVVLLSIEIECNVVGINCFSLWNVTPTCFHLVDEEHSK